LYLWENVISPANPKFRPYCPAAPSPPTPTATGARTSQPKPLSKRKEGISKSPARQPKPLSKRKEAISKIAAENANYFRKLDQQQNQVSSDLKYTCPLCSGNMVFSVAEYGGHTIPCPHCSQQILLPSS